MQLRTARLCLDCEEVHDGQQCPVCASETFAFITRWVPVPERQTKRTRPPEVTRPEALHTYREMLEPTPRPGGVWRTVGRGALGLALVGIAGWVFKQNSPASKPEEGATDSARDRQRQ